MILEITNTFKINGNSNYQAFKIEGFHCIIKGILLCCA